MRTGAGRRAAVKKIVLIFAIALAACGPGRSGGGEGMAASAKGCALLADPAPIFGKGALVEERAPLEDMAGACRWESKDGALIGEMIAFTPESLAKGRFKTGQARYDDRLAAWKNMTFEASAPLALGDQAQTWTGFDGGQAQVIVRKGGAVLIVSGNSINPKITSRALAEKLAAALTGGL
jgi:hypothetical protein